MFSGNPLAVLTDGRGLDHQTVQSIAREFNFSETTFVTPPADSRNTARVRIFAPVRELPFAAPGAGVAEDSATGSAAAALAGWLVRHDPGQPGTRRGTVLQGEAVGRPSHIELKADVSDGIVQAVRVGGASVLVSEGVLRL